jgi:hypothetical protein
MAASAARTCLVSWCRPSPPARRPAITRPCSADLFFLSLNRHRIFSHAGPHPVLDARKFSMAKAKGVVTELPRSTRLGSGTGLWHQIPVGSEYLRVHRRFFKDIESSDATAASTV